MEPQPAFRWIIAALSTVCLALVLGQMINGLAVYLVTLETVEGWDRAGASAINTAGFIGLASGGLLISRLADRYGTRPVVLTGIVLFCLIVALASRATELWQLYGAFAVAGFVAGGTINAPLLALVSNWFTRGAGLALGLVAAGQAFGQGVVPFSGAFLIEAFGWRSALLTQSLLTLAIAVPLALFLRPPPILQEAGAAASEQQSTTPEWQNTLLIGTASLMCCVCMAVPLMHLVPLIESHGIPAPTAGGLLFFMLTVAIGGRIFFGWLADRIGAIPAWMIASAWQTALVFGFTFFGTVDGFTLYAALYGFGYGGVMTGVLATTRELTPPQSRSRVTGIIMAFAYMGHGLGGFQGGWFYDLTGGYSWTYANAVLAGFVNLALLTTLLLLTRRGRARPVAA